MARANATPQQSNHVETHQQQQQQQQTAAPSDGAFPSNFDYYAVLDFEATCQKDGQIKPQEIIEFPIVLVDAATLQPVAEFQRYVKPIHHPRLSAFCTELTGIQQHQVDAARTFPEVWKEVIAWLQSANLCLDAQDTTKKSFTFVTCGHWDLKTMLPGQFATDPSLGRIPAAFRRWCNLKFVFEKVAGRKGVGMDAMLGINGLKLIGKHHSGIDDCRNIARILASCILSARARPDLASYRVDYNSPGCELEPPRWRCHGPSPTPATSITSSPFNYLDQSLLVPDRDRQENGGHKSRADAGGAKSAPAATNNNNDDASAAAADGDVALKYGPYLEVDTSRNPAADILAARPLSKEPEKGLVTTISKRIANCLRHNVFDWGLPMSINGWVPLAKMLAHRNFSQCGDNLIAFLVQTSDKQRYAMAYGKTGTADSNTVYIRANQGHSLKGIQVDMKRVDPKVTPVAVHGTYADSWKIIQKEGLSKMKRQHVHLAKGLPGDDAVISGMRKSCTVVVYVDVARMVADGLVVLESTNGVILTEAVPPKYFVKAVERLDGGATRQIWSP